MVRRTFLVTIFLSLLAASSVAIDLTGTMITYVVTATTTVDDDIESVLTQAAILALERYDVQVMIPDYTISDDEPSRRDLTRLARLGGSEYVLVGTYNPGRSSTTFEVTFVLYLVDPPLPVAVARQNLVVSLLMDRDVEGMIKELLFDAFEPDSSGG